MSRSLAVSIRTIRRPWSRRLAPGLLGLALLVSLVSACATPSMPASVDRSAIDLQRFMGRWHVIAYAPYFGERGHVASSNEYTLRDGGEIGVRYVYRTGFSQPVETLEARAMVKDGSGNRDWRIWFFRVIPIRHRILEVAPDDSWALINSPSRDLAWIFARAPVMSDTQYADLERRMRGHGVNTDKLRRVPQVPAQVGKLGFADPENP